MKILLAGLGFACLTTAATAAPLLFPDAALSTATLAIAGATTDAHDDSSLVSLPPLLTTSGAAGSGASANATAIADYDVPSGIYTLAALAEVQGADSGSTATPDPGTTFARVPGPTEVGASAVASATFSGQFLSPGGLLWFAVAYEGGPETSGGEATGDAFAHVTLVAGTQTLIDEVLTGVMSLTRGFVLPVGLAGFLTIDAVATADALGPLESAAGRSSLTFSVNRVPEPSGALLLLLSLATAFLMAPPAIEPRRRTAERT